jgi:hypothetical protein
MYNTKVKLFADVKIIQLFSIESNIFLMIVNDFQRHILIFGKITSYILKMS